MLLKYLPDYYKKSKVFSQLFRVLSNEVDSNNLEIKDLENQLFVDTATWGLDDWERELKMYTDLSKPYLDRREAVKAKMRGSGTCTIEMIENTALAYTNAEIKVIEDNPKCTFKIKFVGVKGIPRDIELFKSTIDMIKPAHLTYTIEYTYNVWNDLKSKKWSDLSSKNWDQIKIV